MPDLTLDQQKAVAMASARARMAGASATVMGPKDVPDSAPFREPLPEPSTLDQVGNVIRGTPDFLRGVPGALLAGGSQVATGAAGRAVALVDPEAGMKIAKSSYEPSDRGQATSEAFGKFMENIGADKLAGLGPTPAAYAGRAPAAVAGAKGNAAHLGAVARQEGDLARMAVKNRPGASSTTPSPISKAQQQALDTLEKFANDPQALAKAKGESFVKGSTPTLAEATENPGLAQLQRAQQSKSTDFASDLQGRKADRLRARETAMEGIAGTEGEMATLKEARKATTDPLYKAAYEKPIDPAKVTPKLKAEVDELLQRPTVQEARAEAIKKARDSNEILSEQDMGSVKGMHYMKRAIDDKISAAKRAGADDQVRILMGIQEKMLDVMKQVSPEYAKAIAEYEKASKPINRLEVGQYLRDKLFPATNRYGAGKMTVGQFAKALEDPDQTAKLATGFSGAKMSNIMSPDEIKQLKSIARDIVREQNVEGAARITGSQTAQLTAAQTRLDSLLEKLEKVPSKWVSVPAKGASMLLEKSRAGAAAAYEAELNRMLADPAYAKSVAGMRDSHRLKVADPQSHKPWNIGVPQ